MDLAGDERSAYQQQHQRGADLGQIVLRERRGHVPYFGELGCHVFEAPFLVGECGVQRGVRLRRGEQGGVQGRRYDLMCCGKEAESHSFDTPIVHA